MKQKPNRKDKLKATEQKSEDIPWTKEEPKQEFLQQWGVHLAMFFFGFLLYANTISFEYALDDKLYITHNQFTKQGIAGIPDLVSHDLLVGFYGKDKNLLEGGRYRPLALITYAIEYELLGESPQFSHFVSAFLYGLICLLLYSILMLLFPQQRSKWWSVALVGAALFAAHPLHTEIAATIKGRVEMMSVLFGLVSLYYTIRYYDERKVQFLAFSALAFFAGFMSKEDTVNFIGIIPLTLIFFREFRAKDFVTAMSPVVLATLVYMGIRMSAIQSGDGEVVPELMNAPFMHATGGERLATIMFTWGLYIKLMFFPHPLTHDYYPWHPLLEGEGATLDGGYPYFNWGDMEVILSALVVFSLVAIAIIGALRKNVYSWGILVFFGSFLLYSNLVFDIGTFMNERFMFIPSIGFCVILGYAFVEVLPKYIKSPQILKGLLAVILLAYSAKTISRNYAWENDYSLTTTDVLTSVNSAKANLVAGGSYVDKATEARKPQERQRLLQIAIKHLKHSRELYPGYIEPTLLLGNAYYNSGDWPMALAYYDLCMQMNPNYVFTEKNLKMLGDTLTRAGNADLAIKTYETLIKYKPSAKAYGELGGVYGRYKQDLAKAEEYVRKGLELEPNNTDIIIKLGTIYAMRGQMQQALEIFNSGLTIDPDNPGLLKNIGITYHNLGQEDKANAYMQQAAQEEAKQRK